MLVITGLRASKEQETRKLKERGVGRRNSGLLTQMGLLQKSRVPFPTPEFGMLERREEADRSKPSCRVPLKQPRVCGRCRRDKPSQMNAPRKGRKAVPSQLLRAIRELRVVWVQELPLSSFLLGRGVTELGDLPRLCGKYVAAVAWISLQNK